MGLGVNTQGPHGSLHRLAFTLRNVGSHCIVLSKEVICSISTAS